MAPGIPLGGGGGCDVCMCECVCVCLVSASTGEGKGNFKMSRDFPEFAKSGRLPGDFFSSF
jgi:hypothetical protein